MSPSDMDLGLSRSHQAPPDRISKFQKLEFCRHFSARFCQCGAKKRCFLVLFRLFFDVFVKNKVSWSCPDQGQHQALVLVHQSCLYPPKPSLPSSKQLQKRQFLPPQPRILSLSCHFRRILTGFMEMASFQHCPDRCQH